MTGIEIGFVGIAALFVLIALRFPIGLAMIAVSSAGLWALIGPDATWGLLQSKPFGFVARWEWSAIPMFLLMGYVAYQAGLTSSLFDLAKALLARIPGSLAVSSVFACSGFAAVCGSSIACAAAMGRIAIPEMVRAGYDRNFACGTIAAGGTIGALIPPSIVMILYGIFAQVSIEKLFIGGISIGVLTAVLYVVVILIMSWLRPDIVPRKLAPVEKGALIASLKQMGPVLVLIFGVFGGLFGGIFTATEAGAVGAALSVVIALVQGRLSRDVLAKSITETVVTCGAIFIIGVGASFFTVFLSISGTGDFITKLFTGWQLNYWQLMLVIIVIYLVLGTFMDGVGAMLITLPVFLPMLKAADIDMIWYGVLVTKLIEIGMITPPFGINVFVIKSVVGNLTSLVGVFRGIVYYLVADMAVLLIAVAAPATILYLPRLLGP